MHRGGGGRGRTSAAAEAGMAGQTRQGRALAIADRPEASNRGGEVSGEDKVGDKVGLVGCLGCLGQGHGGHHGPKSRAAHLILCFPYSFLFSLICIFAYLFVKFKNKKYI